MPERLTPDGANEGRGGAAHRVTEKLRTRAPEKA